MAADETRRKRYDGGTNPITVIPVPSNATTKYTAVGVQQFIKAMYQNKIVIRTDSEPTILSIMNNVKDMLPDRALQPVEPAANEAFHAELRAALLQVYFTHALVIRIRLRSSVLAMQVAFQ